MACNKDAQRFRKTYGFSRVIPRIEAAAGGSGVAGLDWKESVRAASIGNNSLSGLVPVFILDGVSLYDGDRVLLKDQSIASQNGIYTYDQGAGTLVRAEDAVDPNLTSGAAVYIEEGATNAQTAYVLTTNDPITVGSTSLTWQKIAGVGASIFTSRTSPTVEARTIYGVSIDTNNRYPTDVGSDVFFFVSGSITGSGANSHKAVFGGDVVISGSTAVEGDVLEVTGTLKVLGASYVFGNSYVTGTVVSSLGYSGSLTRLTDGTSYLRAGTNVTITTGTNGSVTISSTGGTSADSFFSSTTNTAIFTTGSAAFRGGESSVDAPSDKGTDVFFYVSGSISGSGAANKKAMFGGDVVISGSLSQGGEAGGSENVARGIGSHAEGKQAFALGDYSHAEGIGNTANSYGSHAEGANCAAYGNASHVEGVDSITFGSSAHAEGEATKARGDASHTEGVSTETATSAYGSHAEGLGTIASGSYQHVGGKYNKRGNDFSLFVIGDGTGTGDANRSDILRINGGAAGGLGSVQVTGSLFVSGTASFDGQGKALPSDTYFFVSGTITGSTSPMTATSNRRAVFGGDVVISGTLNQGLNSVATGDYSQAFGYKTKASGRYSHAEGDTTTATNYAAHAEGAGSDATGLYAHAEGLSTTASGEASHAEGYYSTASGLYGSHAEGNGTSASGESSHAEGYFSTASGNYGSHAEGYFTIASGDDAHAEGASTQARGDHSHAEGFETFATGSYSHAGGYRTIASGSAQTVIGKYNVRGNNFSLFVVGDGTGTTNANRSDILRVNSGSVGGTGRVEVTGSFAATLGLSGSLTHLVDGTSYLVAGPNVTIVSSSNGQVVISSTAAGGGGQVTGSYTRSFVLGDLSVGVLTVNHNLGSKYVDVAVWDDGNYQVIPDEVVALTTNSLTVDLTSFGAISGTWHVNAVSSVESGGPKSYSTFFSYSDLSGGILGVPHNSGLYANVFVFDDANRQVVPDSVLSVSPKQSDVDLTSFGPFTGSWKVAVAGSEKRTSYEQSFVWGDLSGGVLPVTHWLGSKYVTVVVYDDSDMKVVPDEVTVSNDSDLSVDLSSYGSFPGTWHVKVIPIEPDDAGAVDSIGRVMRSLRVTLDTEAVPYRGANFEVGYGSDADGPTPTRNLGCSAVGFQNQILNNGDAPLVVGSQVVGLGGHASSWGQQSLAGWVWSTDYVPAPLPIISKFGGAQKGELVLGGSVVSGGSTTELLYGLEGSPVVNYFVLRPNQTYKFTVEVIVASEGVTDGTQQAASFEYKGTCRVYDDGTTTMVGTVSSVMSDDPEGLYPGGELATAVSINLNSSPTRLSVSVTSPSVGPDVRAVATVRWTEMSTNVV